MSLEQTSLSRARWNVALLALCQAIAMTGMTILITVAALIGSSLVTDKSQATFPLALQQLATMLATIPASLLMKRVGRQIGFMVGAAIGIAGAALGACAVLWSSFPLFCAATTLLGVFNGFAGFYRFAAADAAHESFRAQAISLVVAGGVIAALVGPGLASSSKDWIAAHTFAGSLIAIVGLQILSIALLLFVKIPPLSASEQQAKGRPIAAILKQPVFLVAALGSMTGYGVMALVMTATPLAMVGVNHPFESAAMVIQWHILGMFAPSFFTGFLIARFGVLNIILTGVVLNLLCVGINLAGMQVHHFLVSLLLVGIGWNFMFVGSTTLLTEAYRPEEKAKTQAAHDFLMFAFVAIATYASGQILYSFSWAAVNLTALPVLIASLIAVLWLRQVRSGGSLYPLSARK